MTRSQVILGGAVILAVAIGVLANNGYFTPTPAPAPEVATAVPPDFSGGWVLKDPVTSVPDLLPEAAAKWEANKAELAKRPPKPEPTLAEIQNTTAEQHAVLCFPIGFPRVAMTSKLPMYVVHSSLGLIIDIGSGGPPRMIWHGLPHDPDYWPTYMGESTSTWDGDTLVVDTIQFVDATFMGPQSLPHSDAMHVVERMRLTDGGNTLEVQMRIEDPKVLRNPWDVVLHYERLADYRPTQHACHMD